MRLPCPDQLRRLSRSPRAKAAAAAARQQTAAPLPRPGPVKGVDRSHKGRPLPSGFNDPDGRRRSARRLRGQADPGQPVGELVRAVRQGTADARPLGAGEKHGKLNVVAISQDDAPHASVVAFLKAQDRRASTHQDPKMALSGALGAEGAADVDPVRRARARKSGATSATSTGPAPKRLSCLPKAASRQAR